MSGVSRMMAMATGLVGSVIAFVVVALYSFLHMLERMAGITADQSHLFLGIGLTILAVIASLVVVSAPEIGAVLLVLAAVGFFFIVGWWAIIPALFLIGTAVMTYMSYRNHPQYHEPPTRLPQT